MKPSPIADAFVLPHHKGIAQPLIPLDLYQCENCGHAQNIDIVSPEELFREYIFTTSSSAGLVKHFQEYAETIVHTLGFAKNSLVVEIGSNDGTLLQFFKDFGMRVLGIDPARKIASQATSKGIPTLPEFFSSALAKKICKEGAAKLVVANNVYAHSDQLGDITEGIANLLDADGVFIFEVSYLLDIIDNFVFDTIYHEHLSYHSIAPLVPFFKKYGLELFNVEKVATKGGSMRCFVQKINGPRKKLPIIDQMIREEFQRGLYQPEIFRQYEEQILLAKARLNTYVNKALNQNKVVVGYGASTTVTTLMYQFELENKLKYLIDDNVKKHNLLSPGCHLEVKPSSALYENPPDIAIVLAWQYAQPIINKHTQFIERKGIFIIPLPTFKEIKHHTIT